MDNGLLDIVCIFYVAPTIISIILLYIDEDNETYRDFFKMLHICFIPLMNLVVIIILLLETINNKMKVDKFFKKMSIKWESFLDKKIKR